MSDLAVVIATNRNDAINEWLHAWKGELEGHSVYVIQDTPRLRDFEYHGTSDYDDLVVYAWDYIDADLGENSWIIPRRSSAIKSYGFLKAFQNKHKYIWTLDDDCFPEPHVGSYPRLLTSLFKRGYSNHPWWNTMGQYAAGLYPRGYPYEVRKASPVMVHHGLWSHVPDLDGITALENPDYRLPPCLEVDLVPHGKYFPMCGMNLAFSREMTPAMYFTLQGHMRTEAGLEKLPFDRFDDIWAGLLVKKISDHLGYAITSGYPSIRHTKLSDPQERVKKEVPGIAAHEKLWKIIADWSLTKNDSTVSSCYRSLAFAVDCVPGLEQYSSYFHDLANAMRIWTELTSD